MRILLLNQTFHPDVMATAQYLSEVASSLVEAGHEVTVVTGRRAYDDPDRTFPKTEIWRGVRIHRVFSTRFGKRAKWRRAADFASFAASCFLRLLLLPKQDVVLALTSPPLISFLGAWRARVWRARFCYWIMDFNPDEAIAACWLKAGSIAAQNLERMSRFSLRRAERIVVLDRFMRDRVGAKGIPREKIEVIAPWSHDSEVRFDPEGRNEFRKVHEFEKKFLVMYSGNHSPCHPLQTVLEAARLLAPQEDISFCFVGGGAEFNRVKQFAKENELSNVNCLPYQPLERLAGVLSAADLHLVVMGNPFVGLVHPCKLYNILRVAAPILYLGPTPSHVSELLDRCPSWPYAQVNHGEPDQLAQRILDLKRKTAGFDRQSQFPLAAEFSQSTLLPKLVGLLSGSAHPETARLRVQTSN